MINEASKKSAAISMFTLGLIEFGYITYQILTNKHLTPDFSLGFGLIICVLSFVLTARIIFGSSYLFSTAYLVPLIAFHFGLVFQHSMGLIIVTGWKGIGGYWIGLAGWYTLLAISSLAIGVSLYALFAKKVRSLPRETALIVRQKNILRIRSVGRGLLLAALLLLAIAFVQLGNIFAMSRFELFYGNHDTRAIGVFAMIFPTAALAIFISAAYGRKKFISYVITAFAVIILLLSGYRSVVLFPALIGAVIWVKMGRRIPSYLAIGMVFLVLVLIPIIGQLRAMGSYSEISLASIAKIGETTQVSDSFDEMGRSMGIFAYVLKAIPAMEEYRYGKTYLKYLEQVIPNLGGEINSDNSRRSLAQKLQSGEIDVTDMIPSDWATYQLLREQFIVGGGVGFTALGEPYMNFGFWGVVLFYMLLGIFLGKMDSVDISTSYPWMMFSIICYWNFLVTTRNDFGVFIKPAVFTLIVVLIWKYTKKFVPFLDKY